MVLDPTKYADWEIAEEAESRMKTVYELGEQLGLEKEELLPCGHFLAKLDYRAILERLKDKPVSIRLSALMPSIPTLTTKLMRSGAFLKLPAPEPPCHTIGSMVVTAHLNLPMRLSMHVRNPMILRSSMISTPRSRSVLN